MHGKIYEWKDVTSKICFKILQQKKRKRKRDQEIDEENEAELW